MLLMLLILLMCTTVRPRNDRAIIIIGALRDHLRNAKSACARGVARAVLIINFAKVARILHISAHLRGFGCKFLASDGCKRICEQHEWHCSRQMHFSAHFRHFELQLRDTNITHFALRESLRDAVY